MAKCSCGNDIGFETAQKAGIYNTCWPCNVKKMIAMAPKPDLTIRRLADPEHYAPKPRTTTDED